MKRDEIIQQLFENQDTKFRDFHAKLIPGVEGVIGVRMPVLRNLAKQIVGGDYTTYLQESRNFEYYEEKMVYGLVLGAIRRDFATVMVHLRRFVPHIDNWAVCDSLSSSLKEVRKHREATLPYLVECCSATEEYTIRFGVVMLLFHYTDDEHIEILLREYDAITSDAYYVRMGVAWAVAECFTKCRQRTLEYLQNNRLDDWTHNKAIQKIRESLRISAEDKALVQTLKRKK